ncbi:MAG TPA: glucoamylase family protein [Chryseosolibacter sp.]|nr:glucoamylase family protein [Chryseosolibacter sp.]
MIKKILFLSVLIVFCIISCNDDQEADVDFLQVTSIKIGDNELDVESMDNIGAPIDEPIVVTFSNALDPAPISAAFSLMNTTTSETVSLDVSLLQGDNSVSISPEENLTTNTAYRLTIANTIRGKNGERFEGESIDFITILDELELTSLLIDDQPSLNNDRIVNVSRNNPEIQIVFSDPIPLFALSEENFKVIGNGGLVSIAISANETGETITLMIEEELRDLTKYTVRISKAITGANSQTFDGYEKIFYTAGDPEPKFPLISDEQLLTLVQEQTFKYFYDFAHPASGMARERNNSGDLVTTGGSGFGIMALIVGIERGFITREEGLAHFEKIVTFLETADRFHGAWSHWVNGNTGNVIPFSTNDNGGDLVETSFLVQGLITFRQYLNESDAEEQALIDRVNVLWQGVEWDWYTRDGQNVLYWHWSPDKEWAMNHQIQGYNEALITYVLAASSPTHTIQPEVYTQGWARNGSIVNGRTFYDITLPVGFDYGGPLFFAHYSFLGLDPRNLSDQYANYWTQNVNHSLINHEHAIINPRNYVGYSDENWGFTASDNHEGYSAHSPTNDLGVISPTAALSSFPYTPEESMKAMKFFYYQLGDRLWGPYGFYDAFNITEGWFANSYLAIDQGPIIVMIENHRTGLLWELFMSAPEVQDGLTKLGFTY